MSRPLTVTVASGVENWIPTGTQISAKWTLTGPDGARCVWNDPNDRDYIGMLSEVTGLDSPDVRESADELVQMDGGVHGDFFYGRRPITLSGMLLNPASIDERNRRMTKLQRASNAMRNDATLSWILEGGYEQFVKVRRQQPLRVSGGWQKEFQLAVVAADPRIYSTTLNFAQIGAGDVGFATGRGYDRIYDAGYGTAPVAGQLLVSNQGNATSFPVVTIYGAGVNPEIQNQTNGGLVRLSYALGPADQISIDTLNRTVTLNNTVSRYGAVDFGVTNWWGLEPGDNDLRLNFASFQSGASMVVQWRDAWL